MRFVDVVFKAAWKWSVLIDSTFFDSLASTWDVAPTGMANLSDRVMLFIHVALMFSNHLGPSMEFLTLKKSNICDGIRILFKTVESLASRLDYEDFFFTSNSRTRHNLVGIHMILLELFIKDKRGTSLKSESYAQLITHIISGEEQTANFPHQIEDHIRLFLMTKKSEHQLPGNGLGIAAFKVAIAAKDIFFRTSPAIGPGLQQPHLCTVAVTLASGRKYRAHVINANLFVIFDVDHDGRRRPRFLVKCRSCGAAKCRPDCPCTALAEHPEVDVVWGDVLKAHVIGRIDSSMLSLLTNFTIFC